MNQLQKHYKVLSDDDKRRVRLAWCNKFGKTERQFGNRLNKPQVADFEFFSPIFKKSFNELMKPVTEELNTSVLSKNNSDIPAPHHFRMTN